MARYHGMVGFAADVEVSPGVWEEEIIEHEYFGDIVRNKTNLQQTSVVNAGISASHSISIVGDNKAYDNVFGIRYVTLHGKKWSVVSYEIMRPRIILMLGGIEHE